MTDSIVLVHQNK